jgi:cytochrome oxidase Cu insertion factor (SCO1/SenC/PrrC family)
MKKSSIIILAILIALTGISIYIYKTKGKTSTLDKEASDFKYKDTAAIDKIFLADKDGKQLILERKKDGWILDEKYHVRPDVILQLLYTIQSVEVKSPVSKLSRVSVIKALASKSTKIEVYSKGKKIKQYFVGHNTQDHTGTYMLLTNIETGDNYEEPFIVHIPGFDGYLTTRYNTSEIDWRDRLLINYRPPQIKQIKLDLHEIPDSSFVVDLFSMQRFGLKTNKGNLNFEEDKMKQYIAYFQNVNCEIVLDKKDHLVDSLSKSGIPFATLTITDRNNGTNVCEFFHKYSNDAQNQEYNKNYTYDPDELFVRYNNGKDYGVAQFYVFGKILQTYPYFLPRK